MSMCLRTSLWTVRRRRPSGERILVGALRLQT